MHGAYYLQLVESKQFGTSFPQPKWTVPTMGKENSTVPVTEVSAILLRALFQIPP
jgi:hypothetical protein